MESVGYRSIGRAGGTTKKCVLGGCWNKKAKECVCLCACVHMYVCVGECGRSKKEKGMLFHCQTAAA